MDRKSFRRVGDNPCDGCMSGTTVSRRHCPAPPDVGHPESGTGNGTLHNLRQP
ncbi:hypothetical protein D3OALGA1CA_4334 [Olavius algarvensis associated proteobacterium Delta 3]|nr:hypothetical protein D3OALGB2SA_148 [Olavius algarvensis associated proteobacterium Delta 3]CAB5149362.1 hypothetical protein D3OALGA1CA_4334 [Olavius algarvensis associated proteobacterium Delta 3]